MLIPARALPVVTQALHLPVEDRVRRRFSDLPGYEQTQELALSALVSIKCARLAVVYAPTGRRLECDLALDAAELYVRGEGERRTTVRLRGYIHRRQLRSRSRHVNDAVIAAMEVALAERLIDARVFSVATLNATADVYRSRNMPKEEWAPRLVNGVHRGYARAHQTLSSRTVTSA